MVTLVIDEWTIVSIIFPLLIIALLWMGVTYYDMKLERDMYYRRMKGYEVEYNQYLHKWMKTLKEYKELEKKYKTLQKEKEE